VQKNFCAQRSSPVPRVKDQGFQSGGVNGSNIASNHARISRIAIDPRLCAPYLAQCILCQFPALPVPLPVAKTPSVGLDFCSGLAISVRDSPTLDMASQHPFTFELAEEMHHFDFFDPLNNPAANLLSYWPPIAPAPPLRLASDIDSIDSVFAQHNPVAFSTANAATSNMEYPFTFELNDIVDQGSFVSCNRMRWSQRCADATCPIDSETGSDETVYIDPRVVFESTPPSPTIAIDDIEQEDSNDGMLTRLPVWSARFNADICLDLLPPRAI